MKLQNETLDVLLVDDDPDVQLLYTSKLGAAGFHVRSACDGTSCIMAVRRDRPDLVILDLGLPAGDGESTLKNLRSRQELNDMPILILSARDESQWSDKLRRAGANGYLQKPVLPSRLIETVQRLLGLPQSTSEPLSPLASPTIGTLHCPHCGHEVAALNAKLDRGAL